jgi:hypothetical protein
LTTGKETNRDWKQRRDIHASPIMVNELTRKMQLKVLGRGFQVMRRKAKVSVTKSLMP